MLTQRELAASLAVLRAVRSPRCASVLLSWDSDMQRAWIGLARMGYVETRDDRASASFRWDRIAATTEGLRYLSQIEAAS